MDITAVLERNLTLSRLELLVADLPQKEPFRSAVGMRYSRQALFVRWYDAHGNWGIGECSCRPDPFFSHEYLQGAQTLMSDIFFPLMRDVRTYGDLLAACQRIRGWEFTKAAALAAVDDLWRRQGISDELDLWERPQLARVPVGISLGLYDTADQLIAKVGSALDEGYRRVKLKICKGLDPQYLLACRNAFPDAYLGCDANGAFDEDHMHELERLVDLGLAMIEQPFAPDRIDLCARLKQRAPQLRVCLDESVAGMGHLHQAIALNAIDELNIKPGRVGGMGTSIALAELAEAHNIPVWIGGMFETGIGRAHNLRFAACFPQAKAHDLSPSSRYFKEDLVSQPITMENGTVALPSEPVTVDENQIEKFLCERVELRMDHA